MIILTDIIKAVLCVLIMGGLMLSTAISLVVGIRGSCDESRFTYYNPLCKAAEYLAERPD